MDIQLSEKKTYEKPFVNFQGFDKETKIYFVN